MGPGNYSYYMQLHTSTIPIDIERFEEDPDAALRTGGSTNGDVILGFLATHADQAFTPKEIHPATDIPRGSVGVVLSRLEERDLVRHRGEYWAVSREADVETTLTALSTARTASERLGPEDPEEWALPSTNQESRWPTTREPCGGVRHPTNGVLSIVHVSLSAIRATRSLA